MTAKRVGDTLIVEHLTDKRGLRLVDQQTLKAVFVPLSLVRGQRSSDNASPHSRWDYRTAK